VFLAMPTQKILSKKDSTKSYRKDFNLKSSFLGKRKPRIGNGGKEEEAIATQNPF
jgi:hypothetical protein